MIKYEFFADPREISPKVGQGEQGTAEKLLDLVDEFQNSLSLRLEALAAASKFLGAVAGGDRGDR